MIKYKWRKIRTSNRKGQAILEMALVIPILLVLIAGIVDLAQLWRSYHIVTNASREGARVAVLPSGTETVVQTRISEILSGSSLDPTKADVLLNTSTITGTQDTVRITYPYEALILKPMLLLVGNSEFPGTISLSAVTVMRNE